MSLREVRHALSLETRRPPAREKWGTPLKEPTSRVQCSSHGMPRVRAKLTSHGSRVHGQVLTGQPEQRTQSSVFGRLKISAVCDTRNPWRTTQRVKNLSEKQIDRQQMQRQSRGSGWRSAWYGNEVPCRLLTGRPKDRSKTKTHTAIGGVRLADVIRGTSWARAQVPRAVAVKSSACCLDFDGT